MYIQTVHLQEKHNKVPKKQFTLNNIVYDCICFLMFISVRFLKHLMSIYSPLHTYT